MFQFKPSNNDFEYAKNNVLTIEHMYINPIVKQLNETKKLDVFQEIEKINQNIFITQQDKKKIINGLFQKLKFRMMMKKIIFKRRNNYIRNYDFSDQISLDLESLTKYPDNEIIKIYDTKKIWVFTIKDIIQIFKLAILNQENYFPSPHIPKNPYTNQNFTYGQLHNIILQLNYLKKKLPVFISIFVNADFDLDVMEESHRIYFDLKAIDNEIENYSETKYKRKIKYIIKTESNYKLCKYCFKKLNIKQIKNIFGKIIKTHAMLENLPYINHHFFNENISEQIDSVMNKYTSLNFNNHYMSHRKVIKIKKSGFNFSKQGNIDFNFNHTHKEGELFVFKAGSESNKENVNISFKNIQKMFSFNEIGIRIFLDTISDNEKQSAYIDLESLQLFFNSPLFQKKQTITEDTVSKDEIIKYFYNLFKNDLNLVNLKKMAISLSPLFSGNFQDIAFSIFSLFDINKEKYISISDFKLILSCLYNLYKLEPNNTILSQQNCHSYIETNLKNMLLNSEMKETDFLSFYDFQNWFSIVIEDVRSFYIEKKRKRDLKTISKTE